jgi:hypothetical protein
LGTSIALKTKLLDYEMLENGRRAFVSGSIFVNLLNSGFQRNFFCAGFEVLTAVVMKSTIFWDYIPEDSTLQSFSVTIFP